MDLLNKNIKFFNTYISLPVLLWFVLSVIGVVVELSRGIENINNYIIFKNVFWHTINKQNLYQHYPREYIDVNLYGPVFSLIITPFAVLPDYLGCFLWCIVNAWFLYYAVVQLPIENKEKNFIFLIGAIELMTSIQNVQFNPMLTSWIIFSFILIENKKDFWGTLFIALGFLTKVYGIAGLAFFLFSDHKIKFIISFIFWLIILFILPMSISSPIFIIESYKDWFIALFNKDFQNSSRLINNMQDISLMGLIRRVFNTHYLSSYLVIIPNIILYLLAAFRFEQFAYLNFRLSYLASTLIGLVILSSSAESPTYIIAVSGVAIWYIIQAIPKSKFTNALLVLTIFLTILSPTDLFPSYLRDDFIVTYSLKALPCILIWFVLLYQQLFKNFSLNKQIKNA